MTIYGVEFRTDSGSASKEIKAASVGAAPTMARRISSADTDAHCFQPYESEAAVNEIIVADEEGQELAVWRD